MAALPSNAHISNHPCVQAKLSQLRSKSTQAREVKSLINEIATIVGVEALGSCLKTVESGHVCFVPAICHGFPFVGIKEEQLLKVEEPASF